MTAPGYLRLATAATFVVAWIFIGLNEWELHKMRAAMREMPPPMIPCHQGMTLLPGQSCYETLVIPLNPPEEARAGPRRESSY